MESRKGPTMTTIIVINGVSSLLAAAGIGGFLARQQRQTRKLVVKPVYVIAPARDEAGKQ